MIILNILGLALASESMAEDLLDRINSSAKRREIELLKAIERSPPPQKPLTDLPQTDVREAIDRKQIDLNDTELPRKIGSTSDQGHPPTLTEQNTQPNGGDLVKPLAPTTPQVETIDTSKILGGASSPLTVVTPQTSHAEKPEAPANTQSQSVIPRNDSSRWPEIKASELKMTDAQNDRSSPLPLDRPPALSDPRSPFYYLDVNSEVSPPLGRRTQNEGDLWIRQLREKQSGRTSLSFRYPGPSSSGIFGVLPRRHVFTTAGVGVGPYDTKVSFIEAGVMPPSFDLSFSIYGERAQWLDPYTNTGKLATSIYGLICGSGATFSSGISFTPCVGYGASYGVYKARDYRDEIEVVSVKVKPAKIAIVKGTYVYEIFQGQTIDWQIGYDEDVFLWGGFARIMASTPIPTVYAGIQTHGKQRNALILSSTVVAR